MEPIRRRHARSLAHPTLAALACTLFAQAGCKVGPDFSRPPATVTPAWHAAAGDPRVATQTAVDALWWKGFDDPTLDHLIQLGMAQNLPLQIAGVRILEARAQMAVATGMQFPQTQLAFASATAIGLSKHAVDLASAVGVPQRFGTFAVGFDASWELDFWGKYRRGVEAEANNMLATVADYYASLVSLTAEIARTYVTIRTDEVLLEQARQNAKLQEDALGIAQARFQNGATSELDPAQASTLLESTRATIPQLDMELQQGRNALATLLGQSVDAVASLLDGPKTIPHAPDKVTVGVPAEILRRRPDVRSAELAAAAQCARIGVAKAQLYPSFTLLGTIGLQSSTAGVSSKNLFSTSAVFYSAGPQINWPFLNYGRLTNTVRVEDARFQQLLIAYRQTVLKAVQEVEDALTGYVNGAETARFEKASAEAAQRSADIALAQYREGATDYQRVVDAQRQLLQQQNNLASASSSVATSVIALYKALGGGWEVQEPPTVPPQTQQEMQQRTNWGNMLSQPGTASGGQTATAPASH
ncbi:MAG TPA: efflux transporter outer membrane subunit [Polyangia bacterium]|nr:efflux transporter outer membrane subunit [Polyangia bacterium]